MKTIKTITIILLATLQFSSIAQKTENEYTGFGGPILMFSQTNDSWNSAIGGFGGFTYKEKISLGGFGMGYMKDFKFKNSTADIESGGIYVALSPLKNINIPLLIEFGKAKVGKEEISFSSIIPGVEYNFIMQDYLRIGINASYRKSKLNSNNLIEEKDLNGMNLMIGFKFGSF